MTSLRPRLAAMLENPITLWEARGRSRSGATPFALAAFLGAVAAVAATLFSLAAVGSPEHDPAAGQLERVAYHSMTFQLVLAALVAPALGARSIAGERERGTFEALILGRLRPRSIVAGKLVAAVAFLVLFVVAALPLYVVVFLHAGVGLGQLAVAEVLTLATVIGGVSLGMFFSAICASSSTATLGACALAMAVCLDVVFSGLVPAPGAGLAQTRSQLLAGRSGQDTTGLATDAAGRPLPPRQEHLAPLRLVNPLYALHQAVTDPQPAVDPDGIPVARVAHSVVPGDTTWSTWGLRLKPWVYSVLLAAVSSLVMLAGASRLLDGRGRRRATRQQPQPLGTESRPSETQAGAA
ncbi:MAG: ABC transporter permease [Acidimicrobiales bacterium]